MSVILEIRDEQGSRRLLGLAEGLHILGRDPQRCDVLLGDSLVSRRHAALVGDGEEWRILDLQSSNGIARGGERVSNAVLEPGDELRLGNLEITFRERRPSDDSIPVQQAVPDRGGSGNREQAPEAFGHLDRKDAEGISALRGTGPLNDEARLVLLLEVNRLLRSLPAGPSLGDRACALVRAALPCDRVWLLRGPEEDQVVLGQDGLEMSPRPFPLVRQMVRVALEQDQVLITRRIGEDRRFRGGRKRSGYDGAAALAGPLRYRGELLGALYLDHQVGGGWFDEVDRVFAADLMRNLAAGWARAERSSPA